MIKYIIKNGVIKLVRYAVRYQDISESADLYKVSTYTRYLISEKELTNITSELKYNGIRYEVEEFDVSDFECYEDMECNSMEEANKLICPTIEGVLESKLAEISKACNDTITKGFDIDINGEVKHFSLTNQDQINMIVLNQQIASGMITSVKYHADGQFCDEFSIEDFSKIVDKSIKFKTYHTTYCNYLMQYIKTCTTRIEIMSCTYGMKLPDDLQNQLNEFLGEEIIKIATEEFNTDEVTE